MSDDTILKKCNICGKFCERVGSVKYRRAWRCNNCEIRYYDRSTKNMEYRL